jgi:DNA-binding NarL/FixJ family response regulator
MILNTLTESDVELIRFCRLGLTNSGIAYKLGWNIGDVKQRLNVLFNLESVKSKKDLAAKYKGVDLNSILTSTSQ